MQLIISFDDTDSTVYGEIIPSDDAEEINPAVFRQKLADAGYEGLMVNPQAVNKLCMSAQNEEAIKLPLKTLVDATVEVHVAADKLLVTIDMSPADGGKTLTLEDVKAAIAAASVAEDMVDWGTVQSALDRAKTKDLTIAKAVRPITGSDAVYTPLVESEVDNAPKIDEQGVADMMSGHSFTLVDIGDPLMRKEPATEGTPGRNVLGEEINPTPGKDPGFAKNIEGAELAADDENLLIAAIKGHPILLKNGVSVDSVLHVEDVSIHTGNIDFDGSIEVKGDVSAGMRIEVTGDVIVKGAIERAVVKAGNNVVVRGGIFGDLDIKEVEDRLAFKRQSLESDDEESAEEADIEYSIEAGGNIDVGFINLAAIKAGEDIVVKQYAGNSFLEAGNKLLMGQNGGKGILYGGHALAKKYAAIAQFGNDTYLETHLQVGLQDELVLRKQKLAKILKSRTSEYDQLSAILEKLKDKDPVVMGKVSIDKTKRIANTVKAIKAVICDIEGELETIELDIKSQTDACLLVSKKVYPNTELKINGVTRIFHQEHRADTWRIKSNAVVSDSESEKD